MAASRGKKSQHTRISVRLQLSLRRLRRGTHVDVGLRLRLRKKWEASKSKAFNGLREDRLADSPPRSLPTLPDCGQVLLETAVRSPDRASGSIGGCLDGTDEVDAGLAPMPAGGRVALGKRCSTFGRSIAHLGARRLLAVNKRSANGFITSSNTALSSSTGPSIGFTPTVTAMWCSSDHASLQISS